MSLFNIPIARYAGNKMQETKRKIYAQQFKQNRNDGEQIFGQNHRLQCWLQAFRMDVVCNQRTLIIAKKKGQVCWQSPLFQFSGKFLMNGLVIIDMNNFAIVYANITFLFYYLLDFTLPFHVCRFLFHSSLENGPQHGQQGAATISRRAHCEKSHPSYYCTQKNMETNRQCYVNGTKT